MPVVINGDTGITQAGEFDSDSTMGFKNRIINGEMDIDQRNAGASVNVTGNVYTLDRWNGGGVNDGVLAFQRVADAPTGFVNSLRVTVSTADSSLGATQYARVGQIIEGFNVSDFAGGTASAATVTFSFWVKSSLTGTFGGYLSSGDESRLYIFQYTINSASTWEKKTVTVTLPSSGTWATNSDAGFRAFFSLGAGSTYTNTANTWLTSYAQQASGNVNVINTLSATWQVTGVQLEKGSTATSFDFRSYGTELALCQRYYEVIAIPAEALVAGYSSGNGGGFKYQGIKFSVEKRVAPTMPNATASGQWVLSGVVAVSANTTHTFVSQSTSSFFGGFCVRQVGGSAPNNANIYNWENAVTFTAPAEL